MNGTMRALLAFALVVSALASPGSSPEAAADEEIYGSTMFFPVVGENHYTDTFLAPRDGGARSHHGVDIMAEKMTPVIAVADGTVGWMHNTIGDNCCAMALHHDDGWESWYIHLNNDTPGTDDGQGYGFVDGLGPGVHVTAGQLIGWVGDSGNAEWSGSHLHFELHQPDGTVVNPTPHVDAAIVTEPLDGGEPYYDGYFSDDEQSVHQADINKIYEAGITKGCNPPANDNYCPQDEITRGQMAAFLRRNLALPSVEVDFFEDDTGTVFEDDINALSAVGIGFGCSDIEYCSDIPLLREELAELFVRTFEYDNPEEVDFFVDDDGNRFEESINALANHGITLGCNPPDNTNFCPERSLTRAEMASFFVRALGL